ncbi:MAG: NADH:ubiquinone oxidoreductase subunit NDUFA12 [Rickettsiales bacterium]|jgi:NADH:ubiquinone oxidoreductase subunit|nr:NADH:ubiquinone oxidoreductase subunit NDUFA12 [Rickettsiales bacterium]
MFIATKLYAYFFGKFVGKDEGGNSYFRIATPKSHPERRWVVYNGIVEASKVPAKWHLWLHHVTDQLPSESNKEPYKWQKPHQPNFTSTSKAYYPLSEAEKYSACKQSYYNAFDPNLSVEHE